MRFTKKTLWVAATATLVVGLVVVTAIGIGIVKLWPVARLWTENALGSQRRGIGATGSRSSRCVAR